MGIEITDFKSLNKNTLKGFLTIRMTSVGLEIRDIALHEKNGKRWLSMPAKPYKKPDGSQGWAYILDFFNKDLGKRFQKLALSALDSYRS